MNLKIQSLLLPFYFGSIEDGQRTLVERELLTDPEVLVDYLDLKRNLEAAETFPCAPSSALWSTLQSKLKKSEKVVYSFAAIAAIAAIFAAILLRTKPAEFKNIESDSPGILFDSHSELPASSNVL